MTMYEKFSQLLAAQNVTPYRIHKETGISTATLSDWKNGKSEPKRDKIQKICDFFNVPISYFYDDLDSDIAISSYEIFAELLKKKGIKTSDVAAATGISNMTFSDWKKGKSTPKVDKLQKIADFFGVTLEYLTTGKETKPQYYLDDETAAIAQEIFENPDMKSLFDMSRKMSPEKLKAHLQFMQTLYDAENGSDD